MTVILVICLALLGIISAGKIDDNLQGGRSQNDMIVSDGKSVNIDTVEPVINPEESFFASSTASASTTPASPTTIAPVYSDGITAEAYIAADVVTGEIYMQRNATRVLPVASMSKLVTAFVATDMLSATSTIFIGREEAAAPPDGSGITENEKFSLSEILYPLLLDSSNIAAEALASSTNRARFLEFMRSYAWEIGMDTSNFADPSGVDPHNAASATDLLALAKYLYKFRPDVLALTRTRIYSVATTSDHGSHNFVSIHPFVSDPNFIGGKTGRTPEAGDTMLTIISIGDHPVAIVVLGSRYDGRAADTRKIISELVKKMI